MAARVLLLAVACCLLAAPAAAQPWWRGGGGRRGGGLLGTQEQAQATATAVTLQSAPQPQPALVEPQEPAALAEPVEPPSLPAQPTTPLPAAEPSEAVELLPPAEAPAETPPAVCSMLEVLRAAPNATLFLEAANATGLARCAPAQPPILRSLLARARVQAHTPTQHSCTRSSAPLCRLLADPNFQATLFVPTNRAWTSLLRVLGRTQQQLLAADAPSQEALAETVEVSSEQPEQGRWVVISGCQRIPALPPLGDMTASAAPHLHLPTAASPRTSTT